MMVMVVGLFGGCGYVMWKEAVERRGGAYGAGALELFEGARHDVRFVLAAVGCVVAKEVVLVRKKKVCLSGSREEPWLQRLERR